jgi:hypothetical protein
MVTWAVVYHLRQEGGRENHIARRYVLNAPDDATASDVRFALDAAGMTPVEFGIEWANHSVIAPNEGQVFDTRGEPESVAWEEVLRAGNADRRVTLRLSPSLHRRVTSAAETTGKSINAWCIEALEQFVVDAPADIDYARFTERARSVLALAQEEARQLNHNYLGTEHQLLGLVRLEEAIAGRVLGHLGVTIDRARDSVTYIIGRGSANSPAGELGLTPRAKKVLTLAVSESRRLNNKYVGTEHILLGLVREGEGIAAGMLESMGVSLDMVRQRVMETTIKTNMESHGSAGVPSRKCSFCGKGQGAVTRLIAGPGGVYICNECVALSNTIIADNLTSDTLPVREG